MAQRALRWCWGISGIVLSIVGSVRTAEACSCPAISRTVLPSGAAPAPRNTHVWIFDTKHGAESTPTYELRAGAEVVKVARRNYVPEEFDKLERIGTSFVAELVPEKLLDVDGRYDVFVEGEEEPISSFSVRATEDTASPEWDGPARELQISQNSVNEMGCTLGQPSSFLVLKTPVDTDTPRNDLMFRVTLLDESGHDGVTVHQGRNDLLRLNAGDFCSPTSFKFPDALTKGTIVIRALDLAGNESAEHRMALEGPLSHNEWRLLQRVRPNEAAAAPPRTPSHLWLWALGGGLAVLASAAFVLRDEKD